MMSLKLMKTISKTCYAQCAGVEHAKIEFKKLEIELAKILRIKHKVHVSKLIRGQEITEYS